MMESLSISPPLLRPDKILSAISRHFCSVVDAHLWLNFSPEALARALLADPHASQQQQVGLCEF